MFAALLALGTCLGACHGNVTNLKGTADSNSRNGVDSTPADVSKSVNSTSSGASSIKGTSDTTHIRPVIIKQAKDSLPKQK